MFNVDGNVLLLVVFIIAVVMVAAQIFRRQDTVTWGDLPGAIGTVQTVAGELYNVAVAAVQMVEQLKATGAITDNTEAINRAADYVQTFFPHIDRAVIIDTCEAAYFALKTFGVPVPSVKIVTAPTTPTTAPEVAPGVAPVAGL